MTSPGGKEVGRVSVRVVPDTSKFREELKKKLQKEANDPIEVPVTPDLEQFKEKLKTEVAAAAAGTKVEIPVDLDRNSLQQASTALRQLTNANMPNFLNDMSRWDMAMRRVVENSTRIRDSLERTAIRFRLMTESALNMKSHFDGISNRVDRLKGTIGQLRFDPMENGIKRVADSIRRIPGYIGLIRFGPVETGLNRGASAVQSFGDRSRSIFKGIGTAITAVGKVIRTVVGTIATGLGNVFSTVGGMLPQLLGSGLEKFGESLQNIGEALDDVGKKGTSSAKNVGSALLAAAQAGISLVGAFLQLGGISALLVVAGAGITAAWGLAAGVIGAIPGLLFALGAPIGVVMLGMDGIKKAAETARPAFEKLKASVSSAFQEGLTPMFKTLGQILPKITDDVRGVAFAISLVGRDLATFLNTESSIRLMGDALDNVTRAIKEMKPGITDIISGFLQVAAQREVFDLLTSAVNTFGQAFRDSVQRSIADKTFQEAIKGLSGIIDTLTQSLVGLVTNGLAVLANSAPGIQSFFDSLNEFFGGFNWGALGTAVGEVFSGIAEGIRSVEPGTVQKIQEAFQRLGDVFQNKDFQNALGNIIEAIPAVIDSLGFLTSAFVSTASGVAGAFQVIQGTTQSVSKFFEGDWIGADAAAQRAVEGWRAIGEAFTGGGDDTSAAASEAAQKARDALKNGFSELPPAVKAELDKLDPAAKEALTKLLTTAGSSAAEVPDKVKQGLDPVPAAAKAIFDQIAPAIEGAFQSLGGVASTGMGDIERAIGDGMIRIRELFTRGFQTMAPLVTLAFQGIKTAADTEMGLLVTAVQTKLAELGTQFTTAKTWLSDFGIAFTNLGTQIVPFGVILVNLNTNLVTLNTTFGTVNNGLLNVSTSFTALSTTVTTLNTGVTTLNQSLATIAQSLTTVYTGISTLITSVTNLSTLLATLNTGFVTLNTTLVNFGTQLSQLNLSIPMLITGLQNLSTALITLNTSVPVLVQNLTNLSTTITALLTSIQTLITALTSLSTAFTTLETTIATSMTNIQTTVTTTLDAIRTAWETGTQEWVRLIQDAMAQIVDAIATGMGDAVASVQTGIDLMISALQGAVSRFHDVGAQMGQGLVDGLRSKQGEVEAAARDLANAAASALALAAQVHSPSRVFMRLGNFLSLGLAEGMRRGHKHVRRQARQIVHDLEGYDKFFQQMWAPKGWQVSFPEYNTTPREYSRTAINEWRDHTGRDDWGHNIRDEIVDCLRGWEVRIDGNGMAKMVNKSNTRRNRRY